MYSSSSPLKNLFIIDLKHGGSHFYFGPCHVPINTEREESYLVATEKFVYRYSSIYPEQCLNVWPLRHHLSCPPVFYNDNLAIVTNDNGSNILIQYINAPRDIHSTYLLPADPLGISYLSEHEEWLLIPKYNAPYHCYALKDFCTIASLHNTSQNSAILNYRVLYNQNKYQVISISWNSDKKTLYYHKLVYDPHTRSFSEPIDIDMSFVISSKPLDVTISQDGLSIYFLSGSKISWISLLPISLNVRFSGSHQIPSFLTPRNIITLNFNQVGLFSYDSSNQAHISIIETQFGKCIAHMALPKDDIFNSETKLTPHLQNERLWFINQCKLYLCMDFTIFNQQYNLASWVKQAKESSEQILKEHFLVQEQSIYSIITGKKVSNSIDQWVKSTKKEFPSDIQCLIKEASDEELDIFIRDSEFLSENDISLLLQYYFDNTNGSIEYENRIKKLLSFDIHPERICKCLYGTKFCIGLENLTRLGFILLDMLKYYSKNQDLNKRDVPAYFQVIRWSYVLIDSFVMNNRMSNSINDQEYNDIYSLFRAMLNEINNFHIPDIENMKKLGICLDLCSHIDLTRSIDSSDTFGYSKQLLAFSTLSE